MKDYAKERLELEEEYREKRAKLDTEERIASAIDSALPKEYPWKLFVHSLYGRDATAKLETDFHSYGGERFQATLETVREVAEKLPPVPMRLIRDSSLSFRTAAHVDALPEENKARWESEQNVSPFIVKVSGFQQRTASFEWTSLLNGVPVEIEIVIALPRELGKLDIEHQKYMGGTRVKSCRFQPEDKMHTIFRDGEPLAQLEQPIKWWASPETPNDFTLYWTDLREDVSPTAADLVNTLLS